MEWACNEGILYIYTYTININILVGISLRDKTLSEYEIMNFLVHVDVERQKLTDDLPALANKVDRMNACLRFHYGNMAIRTNQSDDYENVWCVTKQQYCRDQIN